MEKKRREAIEESKRVEGYGGAASGDGMWWDEAVDGLELDELEQYAAALDELMKNVTMRADDLMLIQSSNSLPPPPLVAGAPMIMANADVEAATADEAAMGLGNQNHLSSGFDYDNCVIPHGFGQGQNHRIN